MLQFKRNLLDIQEHLYEYLVPKVGSILDPLYNYNVIQGVGAESNVYIDTKIVPDANTTIEFSFIPNGDAQLFGNNKFSAFIENNVYKCVYGDNIYTTDVSPSDEETMLVLSKYGFYINGTQVVALNEVEADLTSDKSILLGARYINDIIDMSGNKIIVKCSIYQKLENNLTDKLRDYICAQIKTNYECGLYDVANRTFNTGVGNKFKYINSDLPYTRVEYLQCTGTQYLADVTLAEQYKIKYDIAPSSSNGTYMNLFDNYSNVPMMRIDGNMYLETNLTHSNEIMLNVDTRYKILNDNINGNHTYINDSLVYNYEVVSGSSFKVTLLHRNGKECFRGKIYRITIYNNVTKVHDLIPVILKETGQAGMWDLKTETFYANQGTGTFGVGAQIPNEAHFEIEYLKSTGTQYIDTGIIASNSMTYELKFTHTSHGGAVFGAWNDSTDRTLFLSIHAVSNYYDYYAYNTNYNSYANYGLSADNKPIIATWDGSSINLYNSSMSLLKGKTASYPDFTTGLNFHLFGIKYPATVDVAANSVSIYYCKIWQNGVLVRDLIPVKLVSDDTVCMYDKVNDEYYTNKGTGSFIGGGEI